MRLKLVKDETEPTENWVPVSKLDYGIYNCEKASTTKESAFASGLLMVAYHDTNSGKALFSLRNPGRCWSGCEIYLLNPVKVEVPG